LAITTASSVTNGGVLTVTSVSGITTRQTVQLTGTPFGGLVANQPYHIIAVGSGTISLSLTAYGAGLTIAGGSGSMTVTTGPSVGPGVGNIVSAGVVGDYNGIQSLVALVLGPPTDGQPQYGYNQSVSSSQVSPGNKVTLSHWTNLRTDMIKARGHQSGSSSEGNSLTLPTQSSLVTEAVRLEYYNYANVVDTYRQVLGAGQFTIDTVMTATRTNAWNGNIVNTVTMNFGDNPTIRAFFNAGGVVKFNVAMTGTFTAASTLKDNTWNTMFSQMGTITFDRAGTTLDAGSTGTTTGIGYFSLTSSDQTVFLKSAPAGVYAGNEFRVNAKISTGTLIFSVQYNDISTVASPNSNIPVAGSQVGTIKTNINDEYVDGQITQTVVIWRPAGSYVSITPPTTSLSGDFQNASGTVYGLIADKYVVNEGSSVTVTLNTKNVANGTLVTYYCGGNINYTVNSITNSRFSAGSMDSYFTVNNNTASITFTLANNLYSDGMTAFTVNLYNGLGSVTIYINDTSTTPISNSLFTAINPNQNWTAPAGVRSASILIVAGGGGGGNFAGGGGGGGQVRILTTTINPTGVYSVAVGGGGGQLQAGTTSSFAGNVSNGGNGGTGGSSTGHNGNHYGGTGGSSGSGNGGGAGNTTSGVAMNNVCGGGGGGHGASGSAGAANATYYGGYGGAGYAFTYQNSDTSNPFTSTVYLSGGGGGGSSSFGGQGGLAGAPGAGSGSNGYNAGSYGGGGGGGGAYPSGSQLVATLQGNSGGSGYQGLVWIFWP
jgi:hypothetical protein